MTATLTTTSTCRHDHRQICGEPITYDAKVYPDRMCNKCWYRHVEAKRLKHLSDMILESDNDKCLFRAVRILERIVAQYKLED